MQKEALVIIQGMALSKDIIRGLVFSAETNLTAMKKRRYKPTVGIAWGLEIIQEVRGNLADTADVRRAMSCTTRRQSNAAKEAANAAEGSPVRSLNFVTGS